MAQLFDASSLVSLILEQGSSSLDQLRGCMVLDLTFYEAGNAVWKMCRLQGKISREEATELVSVLEELKGWLTIRRVDDLGMEDVLQEAMKHKLSFYDASYLVAKEELKAELVTEDRRLRTLK